MSEALRTDDVRALLRLLAELRELGADPEAWRTHLTQRLEQLCAAQVSLVLELKVNTQTAAEQVTNCADVVTPLQTVDYGLDTDVRARFYRDVYFTDHSADDALSGIVPLYGSVFTVLRSDVISDRGWNRSSSANERWRPLGFDDFVLSMVPVPALQVVSSMEVYRGRGRRFTQRDRTFLALLHEELARDWQRSLLRDDVPPLTPRQREVLAHLVAGASEKEIADRLRLSTHTTHDHVKALHRAFGARSRGELLAQAMQPQTRRTRLVAEQAAQRKTRGQSALRDYHCAQAVNRAPDDARRPQRRAAR
ncbi:MAG: helix-turn-helix transcriptional regulator [Polyangiales bacterium]